MVPWIANAPPVMRPPPQSMLDQRMATCPSDGAAKSTIAPRNAVMPRRWFTARLLAGCLLAVLGLLRILPGLRREHRLDLLQPRPEFGVVGLHPVVLGLEFLDRPDRDC